MGIIAWIVLGLGAGLLANMLIPGKRSQGLILTCVIGVAGALLGGWAATKLFHVVTLHGFFNLSTWLTAIAGAAVLLLAYHLLTSRGNTSRSRAARARRTGEQADLAAGPTAAVARLMCTAGRGTAATRHQRAGAAGPGYPEKRLPAICARIVLAEFENQGKCSNIKMLLRTPAAVPAKHFVAAREGPEFFVIRSSAGLDAVGRWTGKPAGELFSRGDPARHEWPPNALFRH